jgi:ABC-type Zn uptake system ZnuABC Zn-binding protein ZnuA
LLIADPFSDPKVAALVAKESGAKALVLPSAVGGVKGVLSYFDLFEYTVAALAQALR